MTRKEARTREDKQHSWMELVQLPIPPLYYSTPRIEFETIQTRSQHPSLNNLSFAHGVREPFALYYTSFGGRP